MSVGKKARGRFRWMHHKADVQQTPSADQFVAVHAQHIPWDDDAPVVREDEHYETLEKDLEFPSERAVHPWLIRPNS